MPRKLTAPYAILSTYNAVSIGDMVAPHQRVLKKFAMFNPGMCLIKDELHLVVRNGINMNDPAHRMLTYESALQKVVLDARTLKVKRLPTENSVTVGGHHAVVHDVRISQSRIMTGAWRKRGSGISVFYEPVMGYYNEGEPLEFQPILHSFDGPNHKNWTHIIDDWFDFGSLKKGTSFPYRAIGPVHLLLGDETVGEGDLKCAPMWGWRGGAPAVRLNNGLFLGSGHSKEGDSYYHAMWLQVHPDKMKDKSSLNLTITDRFRFGYMHSAEIQFMTGLVDDPFDSDMMIVSYGADDAHAIVARIRKVDIYGLMA